MPRKPLSIWEQEKKREFDKELKEYSTECLRQIYMIATKGFDVRTRLLANEYIIDKCFGKDYKVFTETNESEMNELKISLVVKDGNKVDSEHIEEQIRTVECESLDDDLEEWDNDDNWGDDIYCP